MERIHKFKKLVRIQVLTLTVLVLIFSVVGCGLFQPDEETKEQQTGSLNPSSESGDASETSPFAEDANLLSIDFLQVGKADCMVRQVEGKVIMIDTGTQTSVSTVKSFLSANGIDQIDYMIITHYDNDHIGGASALIGSLKVGELFLPDYVRNNDRYRDMMEAAGTNDVAVTRVAEDLTVSGESFRMVINPTHLYDGETLDPDDLEDSVDNDFSLIVTMQFGQTRFLFLGDAEKDRLDEFMANTTVSVYKVIKLPHHGDYYKSIKTLLNKSVPEYVVTCIDNAENMDASLVTVLSEKGIPSLLTCQGNIKVLTDGKTLTVSQ